MTTPSIHDLYQMIREADKVSFAEIREAYPDVKSCKLRTRCAKLIHQGYVLKLDPTDSYVYVGAVVKKEAEE